MILLLILIPAREDLPCKMVANNTRNENDVPERIRIFTWNSYQIKKKGKFIAHKGGRSENMSEVTSIISWRIYNWSIVRAFVICPILLAILNRAIEKKVLENGNSKNEKNTVATRLQNWITTIQQVIVINELFWRKYVKKNSNVKFLTTMAVG